MGLGSESTVNVHRKNEQYMSECLEGSDILGYKSYSQGRLPGGGGVDSSTEHTNAGYWARLPPMAQKADTANPQEIVIWLNGMSLR